MSKRLQVLLDETEFQEIRRVARSRHMTVAQWVRETLRASRLRVPEGDSSRKLAAIRAAAQHAFPAPDIDRMLDEIETGYRDEPRR